jgi:hypothetical protein
MKSIIKDSKVDHSSLWIPIYHFEVMMVVACEIDIFMDNMKILTWKWH